jgi:hypothetical protein
MFGGNVKIQTMLGPKTEKKKEGKKVPAAHNERSPNQEKRRMRRWRNEKFI